MLVLHLYAITGITPNTLSALITNGHCTYDGLVSIICFLLRLVLLPCVLPYACFAAQVCLRCSNFVYNRNC